MLELNFHIKLDDSGAEIDSPGGFRLISSAGVVFENDLKYELDKFIRSAIELGLVKPMKVTV